MSIISNLAVAFTLSITCMINCVYMLKLLTHLTFCVFVIVAFVLKVNIQVHSILKAKAFLCYSVQKIAKLKKKAFLKIKVN